MWFKDVIFLKRRLRNGKNSFIHRREKAGCCKHCCHILGRIVRQIKRKSLENFFQPTFNSASVARKGARKRASWSPLLRLVMFPFCFLLRSPLTKDAQKQNFKSRRLNGLFFTLFLSYELRTGTRPDFKTAWIIL
jgi:hypothetical protein